MGEQGRKQVVTSTEAASVARSETRVTHLPVTQETAGSNPVAPATSISTQVSAFSPYPVPNGEASTSPGVPAQRPGAIFLRFLKFGLLAWGGPVAQIAMIRQEIVEEEQWVSRERFNRLLGIYQVLPGPEAHELCVYFGMLAGGRFGGFLAGLGFMLPGFLLMFLLSALYVGGTQSPLFKSFFLGIQPAVVALILRAVHRIGTHAVTSRWLLLIAILAGLAHILGTPFWVSLPLAGLAHVCLARRLYVPATVVGIAFLVGLAFFSGVRFDGTALSPAASEVTPREAAQKAGSSGEHEDLARPPVGRLFVSGLRAGLLTFGGAYTVLPFLQRDAVELGRWMSNEQFLDGVALSGMLPAPFIIFSTFVGYVGGGPAGALALTVGIFLPAFGFTLVGHDYVERFVKNTSVHTFLDGVTAGVVGLIAATTILLFVAGVKSWTTAGLFALALLGLYGLKAKWAVAAVMLAAGAAGILIF